MKLPFSFGFQKQQKPEYFLALLLRDEKVNAVIFEEVRGKIKVLSEHEEEFTDSIESASLDEWLDVFDKAISKTESTLPQNIETQKTIFGVKEDWVENSQIKKEYLARLKKVSDDLGLAPIGFLVITEAIAHLLAHEEGAPVSAILIEIGKKTIAVSLLRAGRIVETKRTRLQDSIPKTVDRILFHFTDYEVLPSRIVIFNGEKEEDLSQEFISHSWSKSLPFLHVPQITMLPHGFDARAMLFGAATQMGFELLKEPSKDQDVTPHTKTQKEEELKPLPEDFGFVSEKDIGTLSPLKHPHVVKPEKPKEEAVFVPTALARLHAIFSSLPVKNVFVSLQNLRLPSFPIISMNKKIIFLPLFLIIGIALFLIYAFTIRATVTLIVNSKVVEKSQDITFSTSDPTDFSKNRIKATSLSATKSGSLSVLATGTKETGEKAKGTVTIYNSDLSEKKSFPKGTAIATPNGLHFLLDNKVDIASASGDASSIVSSSERVGVTAKDIGKESNLPSGTKFTIGTLAATSVIAKNDSAFSGGTKKEVTVVAKADLDKLTTELPKNLEEEAKKAILEKIPKSNQMIPDFIKVTLAKKEFDKNVGDEAKSVTLKADVSYQVLSYKKEDLATLSKTVLQTDIKDMIPSQKGIASKLKNIKQKNEKEVKALVHIKASLLPKIDRQRIVKNLSGKSFKEAETNLLKQPFVKSVEITLLPNVPLLPKMLPRNPSNIELEIISQ